MVLCFCKSPSLGSSPSDDEQNPLPLLPPLPLSLSALPAAPRPVKLARQGAENSPGEPCTPPHAPRLDGASPRRASFHCPIPRIPDFEGLADSETDSDDELLHLAKMKASGAATSPNPSAPTSPSIGGGADSNTGLSPLSSLINRISIIGRVSPIRPNHHHCRTPESINSTDDLAVAAHRAEVRRLSLKTMQDELQNELQQKLQLQQQPPPQYLSRTYKRSSMSTIKEDPLDAPSAGGGQAHNSVVTLDGSGPRFSVEYAVTKSKEDLSLPSALAKKNKEKSTFLLPTPPALPCPVSTRTSALENIKVGLPQGLGVRRRMHGSQAKGPRNWVWASPVEDQPPVGHCPPDGVLSSVLLPSVPKAVAKYTVCDPILSNTQDGERDLGVLHAQNATLDGKIPKDTQEAMTGPHVSTHAQTVSGSLSSMDEDGSIHEARKARVVMSGQLRSSANHLRDIGNTAWNRALPQNQQHPVYSTQTVSSSLQATASQNSNNMRGSSVLSQISSLNLPPPLIGTALASENEIPIAHSKTGGSPEMEGSTISNGKRPVTLPSRRGFSRFQFPSLNRLNLVAGLMKGPDTKPLCQEPIEATPLQQSKSVASFHEADSSYSQRLCAASEVASRSAIGTQFDGPPEEVASLTGRNPLLTKTQYQYLKDMPAHTELLSSKYSSSRANESVLNIERLAEEWHQQLEMLHHNSPGHVGSAKRIVLRGNAADWQENYLSYTYPPGRQSSVFRDLPRRESVLSLWQNAPRSDNQQPSIAINLEDQDANNLSSVHRHISVDAQRSSDTQQVDSAKSQGGHSTEVLDAEAKVDESASNAEEIAQHLSFESDKGTTLKVGAPTEDPPSRKFSSGFEKAILTGIKKVMNRKQESSPPLSVLTPDAATPHRILEPQRAEMMGPSKAYISLKAAESNLESRKTLSLLDSQNKPLTSETPESPRHHGSDVMQDIDSICGALIEIGSNQRTPAASEERDHTEDEEGSVSSMSITNAYAEVEAYISNALPSSRVIRSVPRQTGSHSPSSSYQDALSQQDIDAAWLISQATTRRSLDSVSVKSDAAPMKRKPKADAASSKFSTWNGRAKSRTRLLKSTMQFSAELENIFHGKMENKRTFENRTLRPILKHD